jgi:sialate O-acetylesterase
MRNVLAVPEKLQTWEFFQRRAIVWGNLAPTVMSSLRLASLFADHLVLQRDRENPIWGWDEPGQRLIISLETAKQILFTVQASTDADGRFFARTPVLAAGGPYRLRVLGSTELLLTDVFVGEVWLASGQSNMEWPVSSAANAEETMATAVHPGIRMFKVSPRASNVKELHCEGRWLVCHPTTVGGFSAVGYYFALKLNESLGVPVGIIDATWGGTYVEAWTSLDGLRPVMPELAEELAEMARQAPRIEEIREAYQERVRAWERTSLPADPGNLGMLDGWANTDFDDAHWKTMSLPKYWQNAGLCFNGVVWFRKTVDLPKSWAGKELRLSLGAIDDFDQTYFNGVLIGEHPDGTPEAYQIKREYVIPGYLVRPGRNVIAIRVFDHCGQGGFSGPAVEMNIAKCEGTSKVLTLAGEWRYAVELEIPLVPMKVFSSYPPPPKLLAEQHAPAALFHGMIAPLVPYGLRGFLFYQGENNVSNHADYRARFVALIRDWRTRFGQGTLPFAFVQLAGFAADNLWPFLREAQYQATFEPNALMATAVDVGDRDDIHPRDKQTVGNRLACLVLHHAYGHTDVVCHGPEFDGFERRGSSITVRFKHAEGLRTSDGSERVKGFALAGGEGTFTEAEARIEGQTVVLRAPTAIAPCAIRYAFADFQELNLVNGAGLPALPFRTDGGSPN